MKAKEILNKIKMYIAGVRKVNQPSVQVASLDSLESINALNKIESLGDHESALNSPFRIISQGLMPECGYVEWGDKSVDFFVSLIIPAGCKLVERESYYLGITMDGHLLKLLNLTENRPSVIEVEDEKGNPKALKGISKVSKMKLRGTLVYNSLLQGFEALNPMTGNSQTEFSQMGTVEVDQTLGYVCYECDEVYNPLGNYAITLAAADKVMIIMPDKQISVVEGSDEFFALIENPNSQRIIGRKYTVIVSPSPEPVS